MLSRAYLQQWRPDEVAAFAYGRGGLGTMGVPSINGPYQNTPDQPQTNNNVPATPQDPTALLAQAKAKMLAAGYAGAECHTETINDLGGNYTQNVCSAPGYTGGSEANLIAMMSPAQLAAQRAYEQSVGEGTSATPSYFQMTSGDPNVTVSNSTGSTSAFNSSTAAPAYSVAPPQPQQQAAQVPASIMNVGGSTPTLTATSTGAAGFDLSSLTSGNGLLYLGAGVAVLLLLMGGRR